MPLRPSSCPDMHDIRKWNGKPIEVTSWKDNTEEEKRCDSDIHLRKMIRWNTEHFHNVYRLQSSVLSCKYFLHNILSLALSLSLPLSLSSNHYSFSSDLFAGSQCTWKLLFIFLTPDSSPLRIKTFARKCFTNNHCLHCLPNYIKIYSLLYVFFL